MDWMHILSSLTICFTIGMFMAGIPDCLNMVNTGNTENILFLPFLMTNMNNILWFSYGYLKKDATLLIVNGIGCFLQTSYMMIFMYYTPVRGRPFQRTLAAVVAMVMLHLYLSNYTASTEVILNQLGLVCSSVTVLMYFSPLTEIASICRTKSTAGISMPLTITTLFASTLWFIYGVCVKDLYIQVPNFPGIISSLVRIFLLWYYTDNPTKLMS